MRESKYSTIHSRTTTMLSLRFVPKWGVEVSMQNVLKENNKSFESALTELEQVVSRLEKGDISLEESIENFQMGIVLSRYCASKLDEAEKKISILLEDEKGNITEEDFEI